MLAAAIVTAAATVGLAALAFWQIHAGREQTEVATDAALAIARETRQAAERQWQPRVFAHAWGDPVRGDGHNAAPDEMGVRYRLKNEGTGPAFNVEHGVWSPETSTSGASIPRWSRARNCRRCWTRSVSPSN